VAETKGLARTVKEVRPVLPAKDFEKSRRFYADLGFEERVLTDGLVEMRLGRAVSCCKTITLRSGPTISCSICACRMCIPGGNTSGNGTWPGTMA